MKIRKGNADEKQEKKAREKKRSEWEGADMKETTPNRKEGTIEKKVYGMKVQNKLEQKKKMQREEE